MKFMRFPSRFARLVAMLALALAAISAACGSNTGTVTEPTTAPAQTAKAEQLEAAPAPEAATAEAPAPEAAAEEAPAEVVEEPPAEVAEAAPSPDTVEVFRIGYTIEVQDHTFTVLSVDSSGGKILIEVQINNTGTEDLTISSILLFAAKDSTGQKLAYSFALGAGGVDGIVLGNDKLKGTLAYELPAGATGVRLYYTPDLFAEGAIVVALDSAAEQDPFPVPAELASPQAFANGSVYGVGEAISNGDVVAALIDSQISGNKVVATFVIRNIGNDDLNLSSIISFEAKDGEGTKGEYSLSLDGSIDGKILPGDSLRGNVAWTFSGPPTGVKVYFKPALFGGDTIVWAAG
jgi:hypothetical protein